MKFTCLLKTIFYLPPFWYLSPAVVSSSQKKCDPRNFSILIQPLLLVVVFSLSSISSVFSQAKDVEQEAAYTRTINQRADKIVTTLNIVDAVKASRVRDIIAKQYRSLNDIHSHRDVQVKAAKPGAPGNVEAVNTQVNAIQDEAKGHIDKLHAQYLKSLSTELTPHQIEQVKDGMTYGVVPITYKGYQAMIPTLTEEQKKQILTWLIEARELAMDAETSEKKHGWFGKYKGRINNYLSAAGYDLKKEGENWQKRRKAEEAANKRQ